MMSLHVAERTITVAWKVVKMKRPIGFDVQNRLLEASVQQNAWNWWRPACEWLVLWDICAHFLVSKAPWTVSSSLEIDSDFNLSGRRNHHRGSCKERLLCPWRCPVSQNNYHHTYRGILREPGHPGPWIIAMDHKPSQYQVLDDSMRWGIKCLFSDLKLRGFFITKT